MKIDKKTCFSTISNSSNLNDIVMNYINSMKTTNPNYDNENLYMVTNVIVMSQIEKLELTSNSDKKILLQNRPGCKGFQIKKKCYVLKKSLQ